MIVNKPYEETRKHFIERFKERHGVDLTEEEYDQLCSTKNILTNFNGINKLNSSRTVGKLLINEKIYWVLYDNGDKCFCTIYPNINNDPIAIAMAFFGRKQYKLILEFHDYIEEICDKERTDFENFNEASRWYFQYAEFPKVMMRRFKHGKDISDEHLIYQFKFISNLLKGKKVPGYRMKLMIERTNKGGIQEEKSNGNG